MAKLNFYYGAMNCGKSDTMISTAYNYTENGLTVVTMMPELSMRKEGYTTSRAGKEWPIDIATQLTSKDSPETDIYTAYHQFIGNRAVHCVLVDEANFMTPQQIEQLFQPRLTVSFKGTDGEKGMGLGLVLCKRFVEINQGEIEVYSKEGEGTLFKVTLPQAESHLALSVNQKFIEVSP